MATDCTAGRLGTIPSVDASVDQVERVSTLGSSMQRDIAAGREPELDAIAGAVLRAADRHGLECPTIERLASEIESRIAATTR